MTDALLYIALVALGGSCTAWAYRKWVVKPLTADRDTADQSHALTQKALDECRDEFDQAMTDLSQARHEHASIIAAEALKLVEARTNLTACTLNRKAGAYLVERYHFALTSPIGIGKPEKHLVALFAHFGYDYQPVEGEPDTQDAAPTEGP